LWDGKLKDQNIKSFALPGIIRIDFWLFIEEFGIVDPKLLMWNHSCT